MAKRKRHTPEFKKKVALEALKDNKTNNELASKFLVNPVQECTWKKKAIEGMIETFSSPVTKKTKSEDEISAPLYEEIGRLKMELDWLKKNARFNEGYEGNDLARV